MTNGKGGVKISSRFWSVWKRKVLVSCSGHGASSVTMPTGTAPVLQTARSAILPLKWRMCCIACVMLCTFSNVCYVERERVRGMYFLIHPYSVIKHEGRFRCFRVSGGARMALELSAIVGIVLMAIGSIMVLWGLLLCYTTKVRGKSWDNKT